MGGRDSTGSIIDDAELIDLTDQGKECKKPASLPIPTTSMSGTMLPPGFQTPTTDQVARILSSKVIICGGSQLVATADCYNYNPIARTWNRNSMTSLTIPRRMAASILTENGWWISEGKNDIDENQISSEILWKHSKTFVPFIDVPRLPTTKLPELVDMGHGKVMLIGGSWGLKETYIFHFKNQSWTDGPMLNHGSQYSQTGYVQLSNGKRMILVLAGENSKKVQFLYPDENQWVDGPDMPTTLFQAATVQWDKTLLVIGGKKGNDAFDTVWKFDHNSKQFVAMNQKLKIARRKHTAILVHNYFCQ